MTITLTWHLLVMIIISVILIIGMFKGGDSSLDLSPFFFGFILLVIWGIYGGIFIW